MTGPDGVCDRKTQATGKKALGLVALLLLAALATSQSWAQTTSAQVQVADVIVTGNHNISTDRVMSFIKIRAGNQYTRERLKDLMREDVQSLYATRMFKHADPQIRELQDGRVNVYFSVQEFPNIIQEIIYKNANHIDKKELEKITGLRKGMPLDPTTNRRAAFAIQEHLKKEGRYFANVVLEEGANSGDHRVVINITEGAVVRVRNTSFTGNHELATTQRLRTQIETSRAFLEILGGKLHLAMIDADVLKLEEYYKANGYMDVRVTRELIFSDDFRFVDVVFHIHEGQKYRIENVMVEGARKFPNEEVTSIIQAKPGEYYKEGVVAADVRNITDYYGFRAYKTMVKTELYYPEPGLVRVVYEVEEMPKAKVASVHIVGNDVTQDRVIRRVIQLYPGQDLVFPNLRIAENDLARLGIFNTDPDKGIRPTLTVLETDSPFKDILVQVQEQPTGSLMFGAGINSNAGLVGSIVLNEKNFDLFRFPTSLADIWEGRAFRGAGQELRIEAVPGSFLQRYSVTFREPFLFDQPYALTTSAYYYQRFFNEYAEAREGFRANVARQLSRAWSVNVGGRIENINVGSVPTGTPVDITGNLFGSPGTSSQGFGPGAPSDYSSVVGNNFLIAPSIGVTYDTRDSFLRPTQGGIATLNFEEGFGAFTFPIVNLEANRYFTTFQRNDGSGKQVIRFSSHVGWAGPDTPVYERFFAGGFQSIRGFQFRGVGPFVNGFNLGGDFMLLNSLEYQIPILANDNLYMVGFVDSGTVERHVEIKDYRVAAGVGLRITVPMFGPVPIALDFGYPIVQGPGDIRQIFSFWVGLFR
jgi:outer membrane protein assembly factor BamA